ncbi:MAG: hypothetical protein WBM86_00710 [Waterburya sp.]
MMNIKIKTLAVPTFVALSLVFTACAGNQTIESPDAVDGAGQDGIEQNLEDAGNTIKDGAEDAGNAIEDGAKDLQKEAEDAAGAAQEGVEDAGNAIKDLGDKIPGTESE